MPFGQIEQTQYYYFLFFIFKFSPSLTIQTHPIKGWMNWVWWGWLKSPLINAQIIENKRTKKAKGVVFLGPPSLGSIMRKKGDMPSRILE